jgi:hypothetical protein
MKTKARRDSSLTLKRFPDETQAEVRL